MRKSVKYCPAELSFIRIGPSCPIQVKSQKRECFIAQRMPSLHKTAVHRRPLTAAPCMLTTYCTLLRNSICCSICIKIKKAFSALLYVCDSSMSNWGTENGEVVYMRHSTKRCHRPKILFYWFSTTDYCVHTSYPFTTLHTHKNHKRHGKIESTKKDDCQSLWKSSDDDTDYPCIPTLSATKNNECGFRFDEDHFLSGWMHLIILEPLFEMCIKNIISERCRRSR